MRRAAAILALLTLLAIPTAAAHANLVSSQPARGARLAEAPAEIVLVVSQPVDPTGTEVQAHDASGRRVDTGPLHISPDERPRLVVALLPDLPNGSYLVAWHTLSRVDHHTRSGSFAFLVGNGTLPAEAPPSGAAPHPLTAFGRFAFYAGFFLAVASLAYARILAPGGAPPPWRRADAWGWTLAAGGAGLLVLDAGLRLPVGVPWLDSAIVRELGARFLVVGAAATIAWVLAPSARSRPGALLVAAVAAAALSARSGHASVHGPAAWGLDAAHLLATAAWVGGLVLFTLTLAARQPPDADEAPLRAAARRFSRFALAAFLVMLVTGATLGVVILGPPDPSKPAAWFQGAYGSALLGKIVAVAGMALLAAVNRFVWLRRWAPPGVPGSARVRRWLGGFVTGEAALGATAVLVAALLTSASPPFAEPVEPNLSADGETARFHVEAWSERPVRSGEYVDLWFRVVWREDGSREVGNTCGRSQGCLVLELVHEEEAADAEGHKGGEHWILEPVGDAWVARDVLFVENGHVELLVEIQTGRVYWDVVPLHVSIGPDP